MCVITMTPSFGPITGACVDELHRGHHGRRASGLHQHRGAELGGVQARAGADDPEAACPMQALGRHVHLLAHGRRRQHVLDRSRLRSDLPLERCGSRHQPSRGSSLTGDPHSVDARCDGRRPSRSEDLMQAALWGASRRQAVFPQGYTVSTVGVYAECRLR